MDGVVCPPKLRSGVFTSSSVDNLDYNPTAATANESFHGTGTSLIQHLPNDCPGCERNTLVINSSLSRSVAPLPSHYTNVPPASIKSKDFIAPPVDGVVQPITFQTIVEAKVEEQNWLNTVMAVSRKETLESTDWISWSAFHASIQEAVIPPPAINALLPLFLDSAHSIAMIKHSMSVVQAAVQHVNPGQVPILTADQPLFALAKQIQWTWPDSLGEDHFVVMLGGLHIEIAILKESFMMKYDLTIYDNLLHCRYLVIC